MFERPDLQKSFTQNGIILVVFNALLFDLLVIGYGGNSDNAKISELISQTTAGSIFGASIVLALSFIVYLVVFKQPSIWVLSRIYFIVVLLRITFYPFWWVGDTGEKAERPIEFARNNWREFCRYQLSLEPGSARWTSIQHLSVVTFFLFFLSVVSPLFGFQSIGYRVLPKVLDGLGVPVGFHWLGVAILVVGVCYICSNGLLALVGDHSEQFQKFHNRRRNRAVSDHFNDVLDHLAKARREFEGLRLDHPIPGSGYDKLIADLAKVTSGYEGLNEKFKTEPEADHSALANRIRNSFNVYSSKE